MRKSKFEHSSHNLKYFWQQIHDAQNFYIQENYFKEGFKEFQLICNEHSELPSSKTDQFETDQKCLVQKSENGDWYRGIVSKILKQDENISYSIFLVDTAVEITAQSDKMRKTSRYLDFTEAGAVRCSLYNTSSKAQSIEVKKVMMEMSEK